MCDLSLMVKAGVQWGLFGGAIENLGTERHHEAYVQRIIDLDLLGCFAMTETGHGSDVQSLETTATYDPATQEFVIDSPTRTSARTTSGVQPKPQGWQRFSPADHPRRQRPRRALSRGADPRRRRQRPAGRDDVGLPLQGRLPASTTAASGSTTSAFPARTCSTSTPTSPRTARTPRRSRTQPPVLHDARHADPRPGDRRRQRGGRRRVALDIATRYALQRRQFERPATRKKCC